jgi:Pentapeptide repeats (8 copies)
MDWLPINSTEARLRVHVFRLCENWFGGTAMLTTPTVSIGVDDLLRRYAAGERNFVDIGLYGKPIDLNHSEKPDLTGVNLSGAILLGANLCDVNFTSANLTNCDLRYSWLWGTNFTGANLKGANIAHSNAMGAIFKNANLINTVGSFGMECGALFENTIMQDGSIKSYKAGIDGARDGDI